MCSTLELRICVLGVNTCVLGVRCGVHRCEQCIGVSVPFKRSGGIFPTLSCQGALGAAAVCLQV